MLHFTTPHVFKCDRQLHIAVNAVHRLCNHLQLHSSFFSLFFFRLEISKTVINHKWLVLLFLIRSSGAFPLAVFLHFNHSIWLDFLWMLVFLCTRTFNYIVSQDLYLNWTENENEQRKKKRAAIEVWNRRSFVCRCLCVKECIFFFVVLNQKKSFYLIFRFNEHSFLGKWWADNME